VDLTQQLIALSQIIAIDFVLAGDNAIVVGMAASRVHPSLRARVILWGVGGAVVLRILFAAVATQLLTIVGLTLAGGILLLWVCWKMYREIGLAAAQAAFAGVPAAPVQTMTFGAALMQIIIADVSMSLDNVLAVAGAAKGQIWVLVVGLTVAVAFMALLSAYIAKLLASPSLDHLDRTCDRALRRAGDDLDRHASGRLPVRAPGGVRRRCAAHVQHAPVLTRRTQARPSAQSSR
jgi:YjbE family integral membrane protein